MFILRAKVSAEDVSESYSLIGVAGADAITKLKARFVTLPEQTLHLSQHEDTVILKLGAERFEMIAPIAALPALRDDLARQLDITDTIDWDLLDIRAGIPYITPATQEQFVPQMANLDLIGGVSFTKGCYPGQEIVARMHYLGKLKQRMVLAHIASAINPQPGDKVYSRHLGDQASGTIVNAAPAPEGGYDVLAVLQIESAAQNDAHWKTPDGPALKLKPLPYPLPG
jgi:folate-binding protein YgfZ